MPEVEVPENLQQIISDFANDLAIAFPEYAYSWAFLTRQLEPQQLGEIFLHITKVYPERFFDILYQNEDIFAADSEYCVEFLPGVDFKVLYNCEGVSENTKQAIWKYLQLVLVSVLKSVQDKDIFGDAMNLFDGVNETLLQEKLSETLAGISDFFKGPFANAEGGDESDANANANANANSESFFDANMEENFRRAFDISGGQVPNAEELHGHLQGLFNGKIGSLAKELAEEISGDMEKMFAGDKTNIHSTQDLLKQMMKNPKKMMDLMKTVGGKITERMKSGDITEEDIMKEAGDIMNKMRGMGGKGDFGKILQNLAKGMSGGKGKFNAGAFQKMERQFAQKERLNAKLEQRRTQIEKGKAAAKVEPKVKLETTADPNKKVFRIAEEHQETSAAPAQAPAAAAPISDEELIASFEASKPVVSTNTKKKGKSKK